MASNVQGNVTNSGMEAQQANASNGTSYDMQLYKWNIIRYHICNMETIDANLDGH